jgi:hypothetical protein
VRSVGAVVERTDLDGAVEVSIGAGWMTVHAAAAAPGPSIAAVTLSPEPVQLAAASASVSSGCAIPSGG